MEIKEVLKKLRKEKGITQEEISKILNISRGAYAKYETGANLPPAPNIKKLADFYGVSADYLLGRYKET